MSIDLEKKDGAILLSDNVRNMNIELDEEEEITSESL